MKDILGYLKKTLIFFSILFTSFFSLSSSLYSAEEFDISASLEHTVLGNREVETIADISIKANGNPRVLSFYTITIPQEGIEPTISLINSTKELDFSVYDRNNATDIAITFTDLVISDSKDIVLRVAYTTPLDIQGGRISIESKLTGISTDYISIIYPKDMGNVVWSSNTLSKFSGQGNFYKAEISNPSSDMTVLVLGDSVTYEFTITRALSNSLKDPQTYDVTLPQDDITQTLILESLTPLPDLSSRDEEGNLTVSYIIESNEQIDVSIKGEILLLDSSFEIEKPTNPFLLKEFSYWNISNDQEISNINRYIDRNWIDLPSDFEGIDDFKNDTNRESFYKAIYKYIVNRLEVDKSSTTVLQGGSRDGASLVLENVSKSDADDYADLCVATFRHYGIPSRMNIGYLTDISGITEDGIFHSWCEYYDLVEQSWISLDPFLEDYKNVDLYQSSLKDHIKIISRGKSPVSPKLAFYTENDFRVQSTNSETTPSFSFTAEILFQENLAIWNFIKGSIYIKNTGNIPLTQFSIENENIPISNHIDLISNEKTLLLLPGEEISIPFNIPTSKILDVGNPVDINVSILGSSESQYFKTIDIESSLNILTPIWVNMISYTVILIVFLAVVFLVYLVYKRYLQ